MPFVPVREAIWSCIRAKTSELQGLPIPSASHGVWGNSAGSDDSRGRNPQDGAVPLLDVHGQDACVVTRGRVVGVRRRVRPSRGSMYCVQYTVSLPRNGERMAATQGTRRPVNGKVAADHGETIDIGWAAIQASQARRGT